MQRIFRWFQAPRQQPLPEFWEEYIELFAWKQDKKLPIEAQRFIVFDTETTGLDPKSDRILSIGAVGVHNWQIDLNDHLECYLRQNQQSSSKEVAIHGILPVDKEHMLHESVAIRNFVTYIGNAILVGHHVSFDVNMINQALRRMELPPLRNKTVDTQRLAMRLKPPSQGYAQPGTYGLDDLCKQYRIPCSDRHTAAGDAYITAVLFLKLLARLEARGVKTVAGVLR